MMYLFLIIYICIYISTFIYHTLHIQYITTDIWYLNIIVTSILKMECPSYRNNGREETTDT